MNKANDLLKKGLGVDLQLLSNREKTLQIDAQREHNGLPELLVSAARADIADYLTWYNTHRAHSILERLTPDEAYFAGLPQLKQAA